MNSVSQHQGQQQNLDKFWHLYMPGSHQSSLLNSSEWVSYFVSDKGSQCIDRLGSNKNNLYQGTLLGPEHLARYSITSSSSPLVLLCNVSNAMHGFPSSSSCSSSMAKISETKQIFGLCSQIRNLFHILQCTNGIMLIISCRQSSRPLSVPFLIHRKFRSQAGSALVPPSPGGCI